MFWDKSKVVTQLGGRKTLKYQLTDEPLDSSGVLCLFRLSIFTNHLMETEVFIGWFFFFLHDEVFLSNRVVEPAPEKEKDL